MIENNSLSKILVILIISVITTAFIPNVSKATVSSTGYDFEQVEMGSSKSTTVSITNLGETEAEISGIVFANTTCGDFSITYIPDDKKIPVEGIMEIEISYTPSVIGTCSDTLRIYNGTPIPSMVIFVGTGVEPVTAKIAVFSAQDQALVQIRAIQSFVNEKLSSGALKGTGKGKATAQNRIKTFNKMLVIAAHMIENGNIQAAHNKLVTIYNKTDGNPNPEDFVTDKSAAGEFAAGEFAAGDSAKESLAGQIQDLLSSLNSI